MTASALGITIGTQRLRASVYPPGSGPELSWSSTLTIADRGTECGTHDENPRVPPGGLAIGGFVERIGDPVPITAPDGSTHSAEQLTASAVRSLRTGAASAFTRAPDLVVGYPSYWGAHQSSALATAIEELRLPGGLELRPDAECALANLGMSPDHPSAGAIAIVDIGASGTSIALAEAGRGTLLSPAVRLDEPSGTELDHALMKHVLRHVVEATALLPAADPNVTAALTALRRRCQAAKEELSRSTTTVIDVDLPGQRGQVRVTRTELEDLLRPPLERVIIGVRETLERSGKSIPDLTAIAAIGGGSSSGLVIQFLSEQFQVPILTDAEPATIAARGAALLAARQGGETDLLPGAMAPHPANPGAPGAAAPRPAGPASGPQRTQPPATGPARARGPQSGAGHGSRPGTGTGPAVPPRPVPPQTRPGPVVPGGARPGPRTGTGVAAAAGVAAAGGYGTGTARAADPTGAPPALHPASREFATPHHAGPPGARPGSDSQPGTGAAVRRPVLQFTESSRPVVDDTGHRRKRRLAIIVASAAAAMVLAAGTALALSNNSSEPQQPTERTLNSVSASSAESSAAPSTTTPTEEEPQQEEVVPEVTEDGSGWGYTPPTDEVTTEEPSWTPPSSEPTDTGGDGGGTNPDGGNGAPASE
ncbi:MAG: Hsp70 family protein [Gordonia sp. (in: high G+C Gram-positive bacteria)]